MVSFVHQHGWVLTRSGKQLKLAKVLPLLGGEFFAEEEGATMIEYGLLAALIALVVAAAAFTLGGSLGDRFNDVNNCVAAGETSC